jgi:hypothetical protein
LSNNPKIADLMKIVSDSQVSIIDRRAVAEHVVQLAIDGVPEPQNNDQEVLERMKPWTDQKLAALMGGGKGETLADAKAEVWKRNRVRAVLAIIADDKQPHVLREAACARILADHPQISKWRYNSYTADRLLAEALSSTAMKFGGLFKPDIPVERPPRSFADLWRL